MIAVDTETTGSDFNHGSRPFLVTICDGQNYPRHWEWSVNPNTRKVSIPPIDLQQIVDILLADEDEEIVFHNGRFDIMALASIGSKVLKPFLDNIPWHRIHDTLFMSHVLESSFPHNLTDVAMRHLRFNMQSFEDQMEAAVKTAREYARRNFTPWRLAKHGLPDMPSVKKSSVKDKTGQVKDSAWKSDCWILRAITSLPEKRIKHPKTVPIVTPEQLKAIDQFREDWKGAARDPEGHHPTDPNDAEAVYHGLTADYANCDSAVTAELYPVLKAKLERADLWEIYLNRKALMEISYRMERNALTISETRLNCLLDQFSKGVAEEAERCVGIARDMGFPLNMPKNGNNNSLSAFCFGEKIPATPASSTASSKPAQVWPWLNLPVIKRTPSGEPSLDKETMERYAGDESLSDTQRGFIRSLISSRAQAKACEMLEGYKSFWLPYHPGDASNGTDWNATFGGRPDEQLWKLLHPNVNPTGTDTLRWSCRNPNLQNISKKDDFNLRYIFGPAPGREHWSLDYRGIEKRIPAYECGEETFIELFERSNEPPYWGSDHLLKFSRVYPHIWEAEYEHNCADKEYIKTKYKATNYQWIKNTNFALQYECGDAKADQAAHAKGVKKLLAGSFPKEAAMKQYWIAYANKHGYVETMPDKTVNPRRGYPLAVPRGEPTKPLAYRVSGTAMHLTAQAMIECQKQLDVWNRECGIPDQYRICLQVHDELFFDFPLAADPKRNPRRSNLARIRVIQRIMTECGSNLICKRLDGTVVTIPTPVSVEYHPVSWDKGVSV